MTDQDRKRLGEALRQLRVSRRLTQYDVAKDPKQRKQNSGVAIGTLQMIEKGTGREVKESNLRKVATFLGTTIEELLRINMAPIDPRLENLRTEDFRIARLYHDSDSDVRKQARTLLTEGEEGRWFLMLEKLQRLAPQPLTLIDQLLQTPPENPIFAATETLLNHPERIPLVHEQPAGDAKTDELWQRFKKLNPEQRQALAMVIEDFEQRVAPQAAPPATPALPKKAGRR